MKLPQQAAKGEPDPHAGLPVVVAGPEPEQAAATLLLVHGRGATADGMIELYEELQVDQIAAMAPEAAAQSWYPLSLLSPIRSNQPFFDSALRRLVSLVNELLTRGVAPPRIALLGFSQGACIVTEFIARYPRRYGAVMGLTGGFIGPPEMAHNYPGSLDATPVFLGTSDPDPYVPFERVLETEAVLSRMGANVELRRYPGMPHTINEDELQACRTLLKKLVV
jgi:phospholipase/carboxylesterase